MDYSELGNFAAIFSRQDFNYLSRMENIENASIVILHLNTNHSNDEECVLRIENFVANLDSFCKWIGDIPDIRNGHAISRNVLITITNLLKQPELKRNYIGRGYLRKLNKNFLYGLFLILKGIRIAFTPSIVSSININKDQLARFFLNREEGIRKRYKFNERGDYAPAKVIPSLSKPELVVAERMLMDLPASQVRTNRNGWLDIGAKRAPVRILMLPRIFRRSVVIAIFKLKEHDLYERMLDIPPNRLHFSAA